MIPYKPLPLVEHRKGLICDLKPERKRKKKKKKKEKKEKENTNGPALSSTTDNDSQTPIFWNRLNREPSFGHLVWGPTLRRVI